MWKNIMWLGCAIKMEACVHANDDGLVFYIPFNII